DFPFLALLIEFLENNGVKPHNSHLNPLYDSCRPLDRTRYSDQSVAVVVLVVISQIRHDGTPTYHGLAAAEIPPLQRSPVLVATKN
ncbi:hypothetical protein HAX54_026063, partial [Datura stramonium]|nr:hypothetical protein [Datura stramonium]